MNDKIKTFIEETFLIEFDDSITDQTDLFKEGIMDSFGYVQLFRFLEDEFKVGFTEEEMATNILVNLAGIQAFVAQKTQAG